MISVAEARKIIQGTAKGWGIEEVEIQKTVGRVLKESIVADRDFPPFDRVTMDGIALQFDAFANGQREFVVKRMQLAGEPALSLSDPNEAIEIMTGAIMAEGADMIVRYEDLDFRYDGDHKMVKVNLEHSERFKNVHLQGSDEKMGDLLIAENTRITPGEIAIMSTSGYSKVKVSRLPKVAVISTGDELVDVDQKPLPHQIRKSNSVFIGSSLHEMNVEYSLFHLNDDKDVLLAKIAKILQEFDVLLLSGGVSKGKADYLPEVLEDLGVKKHFHRIAQRPGKPFWFGQNGSGKCVFAFPGNPVSTFMCYYVYFLPWLAEALGSPIKKKYAILKNDFSFKPTLDYFLQVKSATANNGHIEATPRGGRGSGDLSNLHKSDAFIMLPADRRDFSRGEVFEYFPFK